MQYNLCTMPEQMCQAIQVTSILFSSFFSSNEYRLNTHQLKSLFIPSGLVMRGTCQHLSMGRSGAATPATSDMGRWVVVVGTQAFISWVDN